MKLLNHDQLFHKTKGEVFWVFLLIISFSYEMPIFKLSDYDRLNPRLYDLLVLYGFFFILPKYLASIKRLSVYIKFWSLLIAWFTICTLFWYLYSFPYDWLGYSVYRLWKYYEGLIPLIILDLMPLESSEKKRLSIAFISGGILLAVYSLVEHTGFLNLIKDDGIIGPFGESYFQLAQTVPVFFSISFFYYIYENNVVRRLSLFLVTCLILLPVFLSESRTGLFLLLLILVSSILISKRGIGFLLTVSIILIFIVFFSVPEKRFELKNVPTLSRLEKIEAGLKEEDKIANRIFYFTKFDHNKYQAGSLLYLFGAGFNIAPADIGFGYFVPRIDYGFHSMYLFPLEQAGIIGIILFIIVIVLILAEFLRRKRTFLKKEDIIYQRAGFSYFIATLIVGVGGHNFWQGFSSGNVNTLIFILIILSLKITSKIK